AGEEQHKEAQNTDEFQPVLADGLKSCQTAEGLEGRRPQLLHQMLYRYIAERRRKRIKVGCFRGCSVARHRDQGGGEMRYELLIQALTRHDGRFRILAGTRLPSRGRETGRRQDAEAGGASAADTLKA